MADQTQIVVIGAGFGGFQAAQSLANANARVLLIDRNNYHTFVPLLYQVATAQIEPTQIAFPVRTLLRRGKNLGFLAAEVERVDFQTQQVHTNRAVIRYDYLVMATGSRTQFLGVPGAAKYAFSMRSLPEAVTLRNHILSCFEAAIATSDAQERERLLTFAIVGGGATGVEVAGALVELIQGACRRDYPELGNLRKLRQITLPRVVLLQSGDSLLGDLPPRLGRYTDQRLRRLGVEVKMQTRVQQVTPAGAQLQSGQFLASATVIWTAGLEAAIPEVSTELAAATKGKLRVRPTLQLVDHANVYAIGDAAYVEHAGKPLTGVAPVALQQGVTVARNLRRQLQGEAPKPFSYFNKGRLAIIGCYAGVGQVAGLPLTGPLPWLMWLAVHLVYLPGFRNRLLVLLTWLQGSVMGDRAVRLILPPHAAQTHPQNFPVSLQVSSRR